VLVVAIVAPGAPAAPPMTGKADPAFADLDREVLAFMERTRAQAAAVAVSRDGTLLYSRGYGHRDRARRAPTPPDAVFRIGSVTKPVTAAAALELVREGKLDLDAKVFDVLKLESLARGRIDSRWKQATVRHLLEHKGGWDKDRTFDPMFRGPLIQRDLGLARRLTPADVIRWMLSRPLQFDPGEREAYSNFGYCLLGRVIEKASGKSYGEAVTEFVLKPWEIDDIRLAKSPAERAVWYAPTDGLPPLELLDSCGGLTASAPALAAFLRRYWPDGSRREKGQPFQGHFFGSLSGGTALAQQRADGVDVVVLLNARRDRQAEADQQLLLKKVTAAVDKAIASPCSPGR
jgi:N-acyl-D-amino-acid deacylase